MPPIRRIPADFHANKETRSFFDARLFNGTPSGNSRHLGPTNFLKRPSGRIIIAEKANDVIGERSLSYTLSTGRKNKKPTYLAIYYLIGTSSHYYNLPHYS